MYKLYRLGFKFVWFGGPIRLITFIVSEQAKIWNDVETTVVL